MVKIFLAGALLIASLSGASAYAQANLYSSYPEPSGGAISGLCVGLQTRTAKGLTNTSNVGYKINSAKFNIVGRVFSPSNIHFTLNKDNSGTPGEQVGEIGSVLMNPDSRSTQDIDITVPSSIWIAPNTSYWIVASAPDTESKCNIGWTQGLESPTGFLTPSLALQGIDSEWELTDNGNLVFQLTGEAGISPDAPIAPIATPGNEEITLHWTAPSNAGSPITKYIVTGASGGTCTSEVVPPATEPATSCTVSGLTNGQPYSFNVVASSEQGNSLPSLESAEVTPSADLTFVGGGPTITLAGGVVATTYSQPLQVTGGLPPYTFYLNGELPPGLELNTTTGVISGTPTTPGTYSFSVMAMDSTVQAERVAKAVHVAEQTFTIVITAAPVVQATPTPVPALGGVGLLLLSGVVAGSMGFMRRRKSI